MVHFDKEIHANVYRHSLWEYSKRFLCSFEWHLTPHMSLSIETCIRRTPCIKRTLQHSVRCPLNTGFTVVMKQFSYQKYYLLCRFNYVCVTFNYVFLSFNYYISSCLLDIQLCSILSFNYYFLSLNYPWSFSHLIITVCHAISYFMNFIELWLVAIQLFNIDSISIDRLYLSRKKHRR